MSRKRSDTGRDDYNTALAGFLMAGLGFVGFEDMRGMDFSAWSNYSLTPPIDLATMDCEER